VSTSDRDHDSAANNVFSSLLELVLLKCNVDTIVSIDDQTISMGVIIRDGGRQFVRAMKDVLKISMTPTRSEVWGHNSGSFLIKTARY